MTQSKPRRTRRPVLRGWALGVLALAVSLLSAGFVAWAYGRFIAYSPRAQLYVPAGSEWSLRLDVERVHLFEPVRAHGLPLLNGLLRAAMPAGAASAGKPPAGALSAVRPQPLSILKLQSGFDIAVELREIVAAGGPSGGLSLALGGKFSERATPAALNDTLFAGALRAGSKLASGPTVGLLGGLLSKPERSVWLWASDPKALERAVNQAKKASVQPPDDRPQSGEAVLEAQGARARGWGRALGLDPLVSLRAELWVAETARVEVVLRLSGPAASERWVASWGTAGWPGLAEGSLGSVWAPLRPLLARAEVVATEGATVRVQSGLTRSELGALFEAAALRWSGRSPS